MSSAMWEPALSFRFTTSMFGMMATSIAGAKLVTVS